VDRSGRPHDVARGRHERVEEPCLRRITKRVSPPAARTRIWRNSNEGRVWSAAFKRILHYARTSRTGGRRSHALGSRVLSNVVFPGNVTPGQWRAHGRHLERESAARQQDCKHAGCDASGRRGDVSARLAALAVFAPRMDCRHPLQHRASARPRGAARADQRGYQALRNSGKAPALSSGHGRHGRGRVSPAVTPRHGSEGDGTLRRRWRTDVPSGVCAGSGCTEKQNLQSDSVGRGKCICQDP
jgi:hypothetical protein